MVDDLEEPLSLAKAARESRRRAALIARSNRSALRSAVVDRSMVRWASLQAVAWTSAAAQHLTPLRSSWAVWQGRPISAVDALTKCLRISSVLWVGCTSGV